MVSLQLAVYKQFTDGQITHGDGESQATKFPESCQYSST